MGYFIQLKNPLLLLGHLIKFTADTCMDSIVPMEKVNKSLGQSNSILTAYLVL